MTGTGVATGTTEFGELHVEIRTVNGRSLQLKQRLCAEVSGLEPAFDEAVKKVVQRGTVTLVVDRRGAAMLPFDRVALRAFVAELRALAHELDVQDDVSLRDVLALAGGARSAGLAREMTPALHALLQRALDDLQQHRAADGRTTVAAVRAELERTRHCCDEAAARAPQVVAEHRTRLLQRVGEFLAAQGIALDAAAVVREVALFSERVDIGEELQRLRAHCAEIEALLARGGAIGRKLDFLLQEALREANTLGAKSPDVAMAHCVVAMKTAIDRMKEQAANLE